MSGNPAESARARAGEAEAKHSTGGFDDARMEAMMGRLLQAGVLLAATVVLVGGVLHLCSNAGERSHYGVFVASPIEVRHPGALLHALARGDASAIVDVGLLLLVATPICRVAFGVVAFAIERDRLYVAVSLIVLAVLLFGILHTS